MTDKQENEEDEVKKCIHPKDRNSNHKLLSQSSTHSQPHHASFHVTSSHVIFATFILASAIVPIYVFDSPNQFLEFVNAFFFPPILVSDTKSSIEVEVKNTSGGWRLAKPEVLERYDPGICTIEKISVSDLSPGFFESDIRFKKPVIVNFPDGAAGWTDPSKWTRSGLVKEYSQWDVQSGTSLEIVRKGGNGDQVSSFQQFINKLQDPSSSGNDSRGGAGSYVFDRNFYFDSKLPQTLKLPGYFTVDSSKEDSIFFLGASLSGVIFHKHSDTWNGVIYGRKRWFLYPSTHTPPGGVYAGFTVLDWLSRVYPNLPDDKKPMECVQEAGEILYLPEGTYHATLNLGDTVAFAIQKKIPVTKTEILFYEATELVNKLQADKPGTVNIEMNTRLLQIFTNLNTLLPENAEVMLKIGESLYELEKYVDSIRWFKAAIQKDRFFVVAHILMGKSLSKMREYEKAEDYLKKAVEISPNLWDVYKEYGEFLLKQGRHADALPVFKKGTEIMPEAIPFWFFYKECQTKMGDMEGAESSSRVIKELKARQGNN